MGFSTSTCLTQYVSIDAPRNLTCTVGKIKKLESYGLLNGMYHPAEVAKDGEFPYFYAWCNSTDYITYAGNYKTEPDLCSKTLVNGPKLEADFTANCLGQYWCEFDIYHYL